MKKIFLKKQDCKIKNNLFKKLYNIFIYNFIIKKQLKNKKILNYEDMNILCMLLYNNFFYYNKEFAYIEKNYSFCNILYITKYNYDLTIKIYNKCLEVTLKEDSIINNFIINYFDIDYDDKKIIKLNNIILNLIEILIKQYYFN